MAGSPNPRPSDIASSADIIRFRKPIDQISLPAYIIIKHARYHTSQKYLHGVQIDEFFVPAKFYVLID